MKKFLSIILAVVMTCTLVFAVSAADQTLSGTGDATQNVSVEVQVEEVGTVYHVDITWDNLTFVYKTTKSNWNWEEHDYDTIEKGWVNGSATIEIVNHSNTTITIDKTYAANTENAEKGVEATVGAPSKSNLPSAYGKAFDSADIKSTIDVSVEDQTPADTEAVGQFVVGTITITIG